MSVFGSRHRIAALETQKREVAQALIPAQDYLSKVKVDEAQAKAYYEANAAQFRTPERVRAEYVLLSADGLARDEQVSAEEAKAYGIIDTVFTPADAKVAAAVAASP